MRFELTIPDPSTMRVGKESYVTLDSGTELHRIHPTLYGPEQFNGTDKGNTRFSPIRDAAGRIIPTIYGAQTFECAVCEIILRCPDAPPAPAAGPPPLQIVFPSGFQDRSHSIVRTTVDLRLVDLRIAGQRKIGVDRNALLAGPSSTYPATRGWAERIHASCPGAQGFYYSSVQHGPDFAVVLFGDRVPAGALAGLGSRLVKDAACHAEIEALAGSLSIDYAEV